MRLNFGCLRRLCPHTWTADLAAGLPLPTREGKGETEGSFSSHCTHAPHVSLWGLILSDAPLPAYCYLFFFFFNCCFDFSSHDKTQQAAVWNTLGSVTQRCFSSRIETLPAVSKEKCVVSSILMRVRKLFASWTLLNFICTVLITVYIVSILPAAIWFALFTVLRFNGALMQAKFPSGLMKNILIVIKSLTICGFKLVGISFIVSCCFLSTLFSWPFTLNSNSSHNILSNTLTPRRAHMEPQRGPCSLGLDWLRVQRASGCLCSRAL